MIDYCYVEVGLEKLLLNSPQLATHTANLFAFHLIDFFPRLVQNMDFHSKVLGKITAFYEFIICRENPGLEPVLVHHTTTNFRPGAKCKICVL